MPILSSLGSASGKGFGLTASGALLNTVTFTANGNWVAPVSVSNVAVLTGQGSPGVSDYITTGVYNAFFLAYQGSSPSPVAQPPYAQWADVYADYNTALSQLNLSYPSWGPSTYLAGRSYFVYSNNYWERSGSNADLSGLYLTSVSSNPVRSPSTSGNITYSSLSAGATGWTVVANGYAQGYAGSASTALGKSFPGGSYTGTYPNGTGSAATPATYNNVTVTPGASYPIVVPSGGSVTIQYYT